MNSEVSRGNFNPLKKETEHRVNDAPLVSQTAQQNNSNGSAVNGELIRLRAENETLYEALNRLVFKIKAECAKGTPLHSEGHSYAIWNRHYPFEFTHARGVLRQLGISHELIEGGETFQRIWNEYREVERSVGQ